jgi:hypothetical protein
MYEADDWAKVAGVKVRHDAHRLRLAGDIKKVWIEMRSMQLDETKQIARSNVEFFLWWLEKKGLGEYIFDFQQDWEDGKMPEKIAEVEVYDEDGEDVEASLMAD